MVTEIELARVDEVDAKADDPHGDAAHTNDYASDPHGNAAHSATYIEDVAIQDGGAAVADATTINFTTDLTATDQTGGVVSVSADTGDFASDPHGNEAHDPNMALDSDLTSHTGDTTNPHQVGLEQARTQNNTLQGNVNYNSNNIVDINELGVVEGGSIDFSGTVGGTIGHGGTAQLSFDSLGPKLEAGLDAQSNNINNPGTVDGVNISSHAGDAAAHHTRFSDDVADDIADIPNRDHSSLNSIGSSDHHAKYTDAEARTAVEGTSNIEDLVTASTTAGHVARSQGDGTLLAESLNHSDLAGISSSDHHAKYTDAEAISAVDGEVSAAATTVSGLDSAVDSHQSSTANPHSVSLEQARTQNNTLSGNVDYNSNNIVDMNEIGFVDGGTIDFSGAAGGSIGHAGSAFISFDGLGTKLDASIDAQSQNISNVSTLTGNEATFTNELITREATQQADIASGDLGLIVVTDDDRVLYRYDTS